MHRWFKFWYGGTLVLCGLSGPATAEHSRTNGGGQALEVQSVSVEGKPLALAPGGTVSLGAFPQSISFAFGPAAGSTQNPLRLRYKLEGIDDNWRENNGTMNLNVRFFDAAGDQISQQLFEVTGDSLGWTGDLKTTPLTHRREVVVAPPKAARLWLVISSAGPPNAVGIFVVTDLRVSRLEKGKELQSLMQVSAKGDRPPEGWIRDGTHPSMARVVELGRDLSGSALAVLDEDVAGHAEWHNIKEHAPAVMPGDELVVEWKEMYSLGIGNIRTAHYDSLPPGKFRFRVAEVTALGAPTGAEISLSVVVPLPFWRALWFWALTSLVAGTILILAARYVVHRRMRGEMLRLENQRALEQERLRIARDIHDDLGARVTQISLFSALAHDNPAFPEKARDSFDQISRMSRELVSALYETVWAVNPENDNLDALGNYVCQLVNQLSEQAHLRCRLHVVELPREVQISSQTRHNISMAVKEAMHNVIKHARASEVTVRLTLSEGLLTISIQDDGCGFEPKPELPGNGLRNMTRRLEEIGGSCSIVSQPGQGTTVHLRLLLKPAAAAAAGLPK